MRRARAPLVDLLKMGKPSAVEGKDGAKTWATSEGLGSRKGLFNVIDGAVNDLLCVLLIMATPFLAVYT